MAVHRSTANKGHSTHNSKPSSALANHQHITKPEVRHSSHTDPKAHGLPYPKSFSGANGSAPGFPGGGKLGTVAKNRFGSTGNK